MRRRVVNVLAVVSAVVCVLSLMLVGRSFFRMDAVWVPIGQTTGYAAAIIDGQLVVNDLLGHPNVEYSNYDAAYFRPQLEVLWGDLNGIRWLRIGWGIRGTLKVIILPLWVVPIVTAIPPVWWWRVRRRAGGRGFEVAVGSRQ